MSHPVRPTDLEVKDAVLAELAGTPGIDAAHIGIAVTDGVVTASGQVETYPEKLLCERAVHRVHGVRGVAEEITVSGPSEAVTDAEITLHAADALEKAVDVPDGSVQIGVSGGVVSLTGSVTSYAEREAAARAVSFLRGVTDLRNLLRIKPAVDTTDVRGAIVRGMLRSAIVDGNRCVVTADRLGGVTLTGTVESWTQRRHAEAVAWSAHGVTAVSNQLHVKS